MCCSHRLLRRLQRARAAAAVPRAARSRGPASTVDRARRGRRHAAGRTGRWRARRCAVGDQAYTTGADGIAHVTFSGRGPVNDCKATKAGAVPLGRLSACVTTATDGACGTVVPSPPDTTAPLAAIDGIRDGQRFSRRRAPRELQRHRLGRPVGAVGREDPPHPPVGKRCWYFSGTRERFLKRTCGKRYAFKVSDQPTWSYLLPRAAAARPLRARHVRDRQRVQPRREADREVPRPMRRRARRSPSPLRCSCPPAADAARVHVMVVGKDHVLRAPKTVKLKPRSVKVGGKRCRVAAATPLCGARRDEAQARAARLRQLRQATARRRRPVREQGRRRAREGPRRLGLQGRPPRRQHRGRRSDRAVRHRQADPRRPADNVVLVRAGPVGRLPADARGAA